MAKDKFYPKFRTDTEIYFDIIDNLEGSLDNAISFLQKIKDEHAGKYDQIVLNIDRYDYYESSHCCIQVYGYKFETDERFDIRVKAIKKAERDRVKAIKKAERDRVNTQRKQRLEAERKEYERLKAKFEKNVREDDGR